jgi:uncharacterized RDD family membrane protein YckC
MSTPRTEPAPSLLRHVTAMVYDLLLVIAVVAAVNGLALAAQVALFDSDQHALHPQVAQALVMVSVFGFFMLFWLRQGQTLGMQAWRLRLQGIDGRRLGVGNTLLRCLGATMSMGCLGLGYLWRLVDRNQRYWHDYLSGTELVLLDKREGDAGASR